MFSENESSYLVGVAAALATKTNNVGFIGGVQTPLIQKFQAGYQAGVKAVNPAIKVQVAYISQAPDFSGFNDPAKGKVIAEGQYDNGADVVYHARAVRAVACSRRRRRRTSWRSASTPTSTSRHRRTRSR